jgi:acyl-CoA synthetase (AMP-forming)/AMP-acid ligase II
MSAKVRLTQIAALMLRLLADTNVKEANLSTVSYIHFGAAPIASETLRTLKREFPKSIVGHGWNMTEVCIDASVVLRNEFTLDSALTVGKVLGGVSVKVVGSDTLEGMPTGGQGEILP